MTAERTSVRTLAAPRRNIELKASDPDPERSLAVVLGLGARDRGVLKQRDTYFRVEKGRLKLREEEPGGATLVQYDRVDADEARESRYRLIPVDDPAALCAALESSLGVLAVVEKERHLLLWQSVRIHLDRVKDLGNFVELEGVATPDSDLADELERVTRLTEALEIPPERILRNSYSDQVVGSSALVDAARAVMRNAHAPYSNYHVGAALRAEDGSIHVGANVENAAYPQGQCAEASAIGALIASGCKQITEVAVIADGEDFCVPCGGCRQRLREFIVPGAEIHLCSQQPARARRRRSTRCSHAPSVPNSCREARDHPRLRAGRDRRRPDRRHPHAVRRARRLPAAERRRPRRDAAPGQARRARRRRLPGPQARLRDRRRQGHDRPDPLAEGRRAPRRS